MTDFINLVKRARLVRQQYAKFEYRAYGREWNREEVMLGFVGDVGDLAKLVLANEGIRNIEDAEGKLEHELADCLWSVMTLADLYDIDLEQAFMRTMQTIEDSIDT
jgi:NTP pyrophosphatase (non-canonical NTP hydrolase)